MKQIKFKVYPKNSKLIFFISSLFLFIVMIIWGVSFASTTPLAPTDLSQLTTPNYYSNFISLEWQDNSDNETEFFLERKLSDSSSNYFIPLVTLGQNITNYSDQLVTQGISYDYRIKACFTDPTAGTGILCSGYSILLGVSILTPEISAPTNFNRVITNNYPSSVVYLTWQDNSNNENKFQIGRKLSSDPSSSYIVINEPFSNITSYLDSSVISLNTYDYYIKSCLYAGSGSFICSDPVELLEVLIENIPIIISPPTILALSSPLTSSSANISLTWVDNSNNETKFIIEKKLSTATTYPPSDYFVLENITTYIDNNVVHGVSYDYRVKACSSGISGEVNCSVYSNELIGVMIPIETIITVSAPTNLTLSSSLNYSSTSIPLTWVDNSDNETQFRIEKKISSATAYSGTVSYTLQNINHFTDLNVTPGISYDYRVQACKANTNSGTSSICSGYTQLLGIVIPAINQITVAPPTNLVLENTSTDALVSIKLTWVDNSNNENKFVIDRRLNDNITSPVLTYYVNSNITTYSDLQVNRGINYFYRIKACSTETLVSACSNYSAVKVISIPLLTPIIVSTPTNLAVSSNLNSLSTSIPLTWVDNSNNETQFVIERKLSSATSYSGNIHYTIQNINYFTDIDVVPGVSYDYRVKACKVTQTSGNTNICSEYTQLLGVVIPKPIIKDKPPIENIPIIPIKTIIENVVPAVSSVVKQISKKPTPIIPINEASVKINDISLAFSDIKISVNKAKKEFIKIIDDKILDIVIRSEKSKKKIDSIKLYSYRDELVSKINLSLLNLATITSLDVNNFKMEVVNGIENIKIIAGEGEIISKKDKLDSENITKIITELFRVVIDKSQVTIEQGGDLFYKDSNNDGVSDYDSIYIYNLDPMEPSKTSVYEGRKITASDKILLGFNPTSTNLVKVEKEQPVKSTATLVSSYKVKEVKLTEKKEILIGGQALPNSFITLYIYSTPIMVTIKTDNNGEWQYLLDKELENGDHTVYTATVNNTGNIVAKSSGFLFTKTAEAITFQDIPVIEAAVNVEKPGLLDGINLYLILAGFVAIIMIVLVLTGVISRKNV